MCAENISNDSPAEQRRITTTGRTSCAILIGIARLRGARADSRQAGTAAAATAAPMCLFIECVSGRARANVR